MKLSLNLRSMEFLALARFEAACLRQFECIDFVDDVNPTSIYSNTNPFDGIRVREWEPFHVYSVVKQ